jgi:large subunit ribosomal protein L21
MFAVLKTGSKQYRVSVGDKIEVERLPIAAGEQVTLDDVLLIEKDGVVTVGTPNVAGAAIVAKVLGEDQGIKVTHFDYRNKHRRRKTIGHRQLFTRLEIAEIRI